MTDFAETAMRHRCRTAARPAVRFPRLIGGRDSTWFGTAAYDDFAAPLIATAMT